MASDDRRPSESSEGWWRFRGTYEGQKQTWSLRDWPVGVGPVFERKILPLAQPSAAEQEVGASTRL